MIVLLIDIDNDMLILKLKLILISFFSIKEFILIFLLNFNIWLISLAINEYPKRDKQSKLSLNPTVLNKINFGN